HTHTHTQRERESERERDRERAREREKERERDSEMGKVGKEGMGQKFCHGWLFRRDISLLITPNQRVFRLVCVCVCVWVSGAGYLSCYRPVRVCFGVCVCVCVCVCLCVCVCVCV